MNKRKNTLDREMILLLGLISLIGAIGFLFFGMTFLKIDISTCEVGNLAAIYFGIASLSWAILLCRNC